MANEDLIRASAGASFLPERTKRAACHFALRNFGLTAVRRKLLKRDIFLFGVDISIRLQDFAWQNTRTLISEAHQLP
jgi:hypothetical protein